MTKIKNKGIFFIAIGLFLIVIFFLLVCFFTKVKIVSIENITEPQMKSENSENLSSQTNINDMAEEAINEANIISGEEEEESTLLPADKKETEGNKAQTSAKTETDKEAVDKQSDLVNWGFSAGRSQAVDTIIVHSVYNVTGGNRYSLDKIMEIFRNYGVAPHYIIERSGEIHQLVAEKNTAYHAGESKTPDGRMNVNNFSIGIEIINAEDDKPENTQYKSLNKLVKEIKGRYKIKYVLGHSDIAEGRKTDPWNFDWDKIGGKEK